MTLSLPLTSDSRTQLAHRLNEHVHQLLVLEWQLRQAHWNTRGAWFFARHELFERIADDTRHQIDSLAERVGALGHAVEMRPRVVVEGVLPPLPSGLHRGETFLEHLTHHSVELAARIRTTLDTARTLGDPVTDDLLTETTRVLEKNIWFLRSHLDTTGDSAATQAATPPPIPIQGANTARPAPRVSKLAHALTEH